ncbi:MAG: hypothetical protein OEN50_05565, partial [Deltaproteobacteria bacterium]|nr:hypothetical protein [Deltaproteobacteria bacterium]
MIAIYKKKMGSDIKKQLDSKYRSGHTRQINSCRPIPPARWLKGLGCGLSCILFVVFGTAAPTHAG